MHRLPASATYIPHNNDTRESARSSAYRSANYETSCHRYDQIATMVRLCILEDSRYSVTIVLPPPSWLLIRISKT